MSETPRAAVIRSRVGEIAADAGALAELCADGMISPEMAEWALRTTAARFETPALLALASGADLGGQSVALLLGESVSTAPLRAIALPLLRGASRVVVRPARHQPRFARRVVAAFAPLPVEYREPGDPRDFLADACAAGVTRVIAYGSDETLASIARELPSGVSLEAHGHGFGIAVVESAAAESVALNVARDIAHYDQFGCLSPRFVFVHGGRAAPFAEQLAGALRRLESELPRGPVDADLAVRVMQWQGAVAAISEQFHRGDAFSVALLDTTVLMPSPGGRNISVIPLARLEQLTGVLGASARHLTCAGVVGELAAVQRALASDARPRVVLAGTMQDPPLDGNEDPRPAVVTRR